MLILYFPPTFDFIENSRGIVKIVSLWKIWNSLWPTNINFIKIEFYGMNLRPLLLFITSLSI